MIKLPYLGFILAGGIVLGVQCAEASGPSAPPKKSAIAKCGPVARCGPAPKRGAIPKTSPVANTGPTANVGPAADVGHAADVGQAPVEGKIAKKGAIPPIRVSKHGCEHTLQLDADTLFDFDKYTLTSRAEDTLSQVGPMIVKYGKHPIHIDGHTDSIGTDDYNQKLSENRAGAVKDWLLKHKFVSDAAETRGFGKRRPVAPNTNADGSDNPDGRQLNRRVEIVIDTCR